MMSRSLDKKTFATLNSVSELISTRSKKSVPKSENPNPSQSQRESLFIKDFKTKATWTKTHELDLGLFFNA